MELGGLHVSQNMTELRPGLLTGKLCNTLYEKGHHTYFYMSFQATGQTVIHWFYRIFTKEKGFWRPDFSREDPG